jgi:hypothetical protein
VVGVGFEAQSLDYNTAFKCLFLDECADMTGI